MICNVLVQDPQIGQILIPSNVIADVSGYSLEIFIRSAGTLEQNHWKPLGPL